VRVDHDFTVHLLLLQHSTNREGSCNCHFRCLRNIQIIIIHALFSLHLLVYSRNYKPDYLEIFPGLQKYLTGYSVSLSPSRAKSLSKYDIRIIFCSNTQNILLTLKTHQLQYTLVKWDAQGEKSYYLANVSLKRSISGKEVHGTRKIGLT